MQINQTVTATDLAKALQGEQGTYLAQQGGQFYRVIAQEGHSIVSLEQVGVPVPVKRGNAQPGAREPFVITKISNSTDGGSTQPQRNQ
jgi:hypothetical protein